MSGGGQGSSGQGGFGQQGMGYGGFGQGYGGFGGFQTPYASQQSYGGYQAPSAPLANISQYYAPPIDTIEGLNTPYYGTFGNFSAKNLQDYVGGLKTMRVQEAAPAAAAAPSISDLASASGNSGNAAWDKLVTDYTASNPNFQAGQGFNVNADTQQAYQGLLDQYNKQNTATAGATPATPYIDSAGAQNLASAMQRYGVSANDLAQSGALSQADYTRAFRPGNQYQGVTNPTQYYQPIYQTQYQNYASPVYYPQAYQNNMMQMYQSPLRGIYGLLGGYR